MSSSSATGVPGGGSELAAAASAEWTGVDVSVAQIESELARLRDASAREDGGSRQRTSVMTHIAWVPPPWLDAAERTLEGMEARHPSRTVLLVPEPSETGGIDAEVSVRCFPLGDRDICGEVIALRLRGDRAEAPASIVAPLAIADLPLFLRWRGEPPFGCGPWLELVDLADRVIVDSSEWEALRYGELAAMFERSAFSDIAWARLYVWRLTLARRWPAIREQEIGVSGPPAEAALLRGWLSARLQRDLPAPARADRVAVRLDGEPVTMLDEPPRSPSDLLSAELDRSTRDPIYEEAVAAAAGAPAPV